MKRIVAGLLATIGLTLASPTAHAKDVTISSEGEKLRSVYLDSPESTHGVLLVHSEGRSAKDWGYLGPKLQRAGFRVLMMNLGKPGANLKEGAAPPTVNDEDVPRLQQNVASGLDYLKSKGAVDLAVVGAGLGASLIMQAAADRVDVTNAVLLSPAMRLRGMNLSDPVKSYGERPMFIAVSSEDSYSSKTALVLDTLTTGKTQLEVLDKAGSGARMLSRDPSLEGLIIAWLVKNRSAFTGEGQEMKPTISAEEPDVETVGPTLGQ